MIFDTHAHYSDDSFAEDREALLGSMAKKGVGTIVEVGASLTSTKQAVALAEQYSFVYASVGVHPEEVGDLTEADIQWMADLTKQEKVIAVGEIGLDYHYEDPVREIQREWFVKQLQMAAETQMPVIIHSREAAEDTLQLMEQHCAWENGGVIHCFSYSREMAQIYLKKGFYLGIGGVLTFKNARKLKEVVEVAPLERIVLETDAPYMTPVPYRGKRNDSHYLTYVVDAIAEIKGVDRQEVIKVTETNARAMYRMDK